MWFGAVWADSLITLIVSVYILFQSFPDIRRSIHILMEGAPADVNTDELMTAMHAVEGVTEIHHVHLWELGEHDRATRSPRRSCTLHISTAGSKSNSNSSCA